MCCQSCRRWKTAFIKGKRDVGGGDWVSLLHSFYNCLKHGTDLLARIIRYDLNLEEPSFCAPSESRLKKCGF